MIMQYECKKKGYKMPLMIFQVGDEDEKEDDEGEGGEKVKGMRRNDKLD